MRRPLPALLLALAMPAGSCRRSPSDDSGEAGLPLAFVMDSANERYVWVRLDTRDRLYTIDLPAVVPEVCRKGFTCVAFGGEPSRDPSTGADRALVIASVQPTGDEHAEVGGFAAMVSLEAGGPRREWLLSHLDFTTNFAGRDDICTAKAACVEPDPEAEGDDAWMACNFHHAHTAVIVEETEDAVDLWIADTGNPARALRVVLDKASECGVVEEVLGPPTSGDWTVEGGPNDLDPDGEDLLLTHLTSAGSEGAGMITLWHPDGGGWGLGWEHPAGGRLAGPHNADPVTTDGGDFVVYAHGNGAGRTSSIPSYDPVDDHRGSIGVLRVDDGVPAYALDAVLPGDGFGFLRDVDALGDGTFLVTDSGCINQTFTDCTRAPGLWRVALDLGDAGSSGSSGAFTPDHADQRMVEVENVPDDWPSPFDCGFLTPYEADFRTSDEVGPVLSAAIEAPEVACSE